MALIVLGTLTSNQELLLIDADVGQQELHQAIDQSCELLVDLFMLT
jgi:hypothetical protein